MTSRRSFVLYGAAASAGALAPKPSSAQPILIVPPRGTSNALVQATIASTIDTNRRRGGQNTAAYNASALASIRLLATVFEDYRQTGETLRQERELLASPESFYYYNATPEEMGKQASQTLAHHGFTVAPEALALHSEISLAEKVSALETIKAHGLAAFYTAMLESLANKVLGDAYKGMLVVSAVSKPHFKQTSASCGLDDYDCHNIKIGAIVCALTGDPVGAAILGLWAAACC